MAIQGKKIGILIEDMFNIFEFWYPCYRLKEAGAEVLVIGSGRAKVFSGKPATEATADISADQVNSDDLDGLIIPGGYAPDLMRRFDSMVRLVKTVFNANKPVASICHAGWMLVSANVLQGRQATSFFAIRDDMVNAGAQWRDEAVVVDGNLITSRTPDDLPVFMRAFIAAFD